MSSDEDAVNCRMGVGALAVWNPTVWLAETLAPYAL